MEKRSTRSRGGNNLGKYSELTNTIIEALASGHVPWKQPYKPLHADGFNPNVHHNGASGRAYRGLNQWLLSWAAMRNSHQSRQWLTLNAIKKHGGTLKPKQKGSTVTLWKEVERQGDTVDATTGDVSTETKTGLLLLTYLVYNLDQTDGVALPQRTEKAPAPVSFEPDDVAERIVSGYLDSENAPRLGEAEQPCYVPAMHAAFMPQRAAFETGAGYYSTLFHELGHSTGHSSLLKRFSDDRQLTRFGSIEYSKEELVAEFTAAFLCQQSGISNTLSVEQSAAYIAGWIRKLQQKPRMLMAAAGKAQRAADRILG